MKNNSYQAVIGCTIGKNTKLWRFINLYGCTIGDGCLIGSFVEIQNNVVIGNRVRVQSHTFICEGVTVEDDVFVGHGVVFINDNYPHAVNAKGKPISRKDWKLLPIIVKKGASIGSNATILGGVTIGEHAIVGAGSVVTKDVPARATVVGNPARSVKKV
jgi:UDP-2-acetamido-3-amino-2,3-dideoxy-glucuronate N-acetyltransferase